MGGNAFATTLPNASFPRMSPNLYGALKARLTLLLQDLYSHVVVPQEMPGKADHGDVDFVVYGPKEGITIEDVRAALGATHCVIPNGNHMCNFAIPTQSLQPTSSDAVAIYNQVDLEVCCSVEEWERTVFFRSYGDLGMILGLLAKPWQLTLESSGLRVRLLALLKSPYCFSSLDD